MRSDFEEQKKILDNFMDDITRYFDQHAARLEQDTRQPSLAMEADGHANTKTRERTEGAATAVEAMRGDIFSARRVEPGPKTSTSFGVKDEPPALPCRDDVVVESGDTAPKSCLPFLEMRSSTAAGGLVPTGETSTATKTTVNKPLLQFYSTEEENSKKKHLRTSASYVSYDSSVSQKSNGPAAPFCRRVVETNPGKEGRLIQAVRKVVPAPARLRDRGACWFVVRLCWSSRVMSCSSVSRIDDSGLESLQEPYGQNYAVRIAVICWLLEARPA